MEDIKLLEVCPKCGEHITLMESISMEDDGLYLVKRCLKCGNYPLDEVTKVLKNNDYILTQSEINVIYRGLSELSTIYKTRLLQDKGEFGKFIKQERDNFNAVIDKIDKIDECN